MVLPNLFNSFGYFAVIIWAHNINQQYRFLCCIFQCQVWSICTVVRSRWMFPLPEKLLSIFLITFSRSQFTVYHFLSSQSSSFSTAYFTAYTLKVLFFRLTYSVPSSFLHTDRRWLTVSLCSPHNLHLPHSTNLLIFFLVFYHFLLY